MRRMLRRRSRKAAVALALVAGAVIAGVAIATPPSSGIVSETVRGDLDGRLQLFSRFDDGDSVKISTKGDFEVVMQRIVAEPGATFGWHSHPGENLNVVAQGTLTLYHAKRCTKAFDYPTGTSVPTSPDQVHLARNEGSEQLIIFATYFVPKSNAALPLRIDEPSPGPGCPL